MHFSISAHNHLLTTRSQGEDVRKQLEDRFRRERRDYLEIDFSDVDALTISFTDEFLGRFLTELGATQSEPIPVLLSALNPDTAEEVAAVLDRRKLVAVGRVDGQLRLVGGDGYLRSIFEATLAVGESTPGTLAEKLGLSVPNANNRLKKLVDAGALERARVAVPRGGREFEYRVPPVFCAASVA